MSYAVQKRPVFAWWILTYGTVSDIISSVMVQIVDEPVEFTNSLPSYRSPKKVIRRWAMSKKSAASESITYDVKRSCRGVLWVDNVVSLAFVHYKELQKYKFQL